MSKLELRARLTDTVSLLEELERMEECMDRIEVIRHNPLLTDSSQTALLRAKAFLIEAALILTDQTKHFNKEKA